MNKYDIIIIILSILGLIVIHILYFKTKKYFNKKFGNRKIISILLYFITILIVFLVLQLYYFIERISEEKHYLNTEWFIFSDNNNSYSIRFPEEPQEKFLNNNPLDKKIYFNSQSDDDVFEIIIYKFTDEDLINCNYDCLLNKFITNTISTGFQVITKELKKRDDLDFYETILKHTKKKIYLTSQLYLINNNFYKLSIYTNKKNLNEEIKNKFFNSFQVITESHQTE